MANACPTSFGQIPYGRNWLQDSVNSIPRAHDLPSAIRALNIMNNVIMALTRGEPQTNNINVSSSGPDITLKGDDPNPNYEDADWLEESRKYQKQKLINPDDKDQFIELNILTHVRFANVNTGSRIFYEGPFL
jgi:hypothetical protein